jgi:Trk-type K+ transport system membrane component
VIPISGAYIGLQALYVIMMYISVYPVVITMRHSNVYEERSLGIYTDDPEVNEDSLLSGSPNAPRQDQRISNPIGNVVRRHLTFNGVGVHRNIPSSPGKETPVSFVSQQIRGQLAHDLWWLVLAVLIIVTIKTSHFLADPATFSVFNVIFEVVSAYGCVGISVGLPTQAYSFCGAWHAGSKLVLCLVMLRGRHRGLPVALDRAVRLPGQHLYRDEEEDHRLRRAKTLGRTSIDA